MLSLFVIENYVAHWVARWAFFHMVFSFFSRVESLLFNVGGMMRPIHFKIRFLRYVHIAIYYILVSSIILIIFYILPSPVNL